VSLVESFLTSERYLVARDTTGFCYVFDAISSENEQPSWGVMTFEVKKLFKSRTTIEVYVFLVAPNISCFRGSSAERAITHLSAIQGACARAGSHAAIN